MTPRALVAFASAGRAISIASLALLALFACGCQWSQVMPSASGATGGVAALVDDAGTSGAPVVASGDAGSFVVDASALDAGAAAMVVGGGQETCAATTAGAVWCWGSNAQEQLGCATIGSNPIPGSTESVSGAFAPVQVTSAGTKAVGVAVGYTHACALSASGSGGDSVACWGADTHGQLGRSGVAMTPTPIVVPGLGSTVTAVAAGGLHTCAITAGGAVMCWGDDADGQLGNGASADSATPVATGLTGVKAIAAGGAHTCALTSGGGVECWGLNAYGQLGDGTTTNSGKPVPVSGLASGVVAIATGESHTCALTSTGGVQCWGFGLYGQLGNGDIVSSATPVAVTGIASAVAITTGGTHSCALLTDGSVSCWGDDQAGQLGDNLTEDSPLPVAVTGLATGATALTSGESHTCALFAGGAVQCWGWNVGGQLGDDTGVDSATPVSVVGLF
jgi:alpha-tubulin suppressor-like RCC1 family protein